MKRFVVKIALCVMVLAGTCAHAMPLGIRTLMHGRVAVRQAEESSRTPSNPPGAELTVNGSGVLTGINIVDATEIAIPEGVTEIGAGVFAGKGGLVRVTLPSGVKRIGAGAFMNCADLEEIEISEGVERIGDRAFYGCRSLSSVTIPGSVGKVGDYAFARCTSLSSVNIQNGVKSIGWFAFAWCSLLTDVYVSDNVEIGEGAFYKCPLNPAP